MTNIRYEARIYDLDGKKYNDGYEELIDDIKDIDGARFYANQFFRNTYESLEEWDDKVVKIFEIKEEDDEIVNEIEVETLEYPYEKVIVKAGTYDCYEEDELTLDEDVQGIIVDYQGGLTVKLSNGYHVYRVEIEDVESI